MPFVSEAQRRYLYANEPKVAKEFEKKTVGELPEHIGDIKKQFSQKRLERKNNA